MQNNENKDWTGNSRSAHAMLGARNYAQYDRETNDYYATEPKAAHLLMEVETFSPLIWECACGEGYVGSIVVKLYNNSDTGVYIEKGQKISQLVILPILKPEYEEVDSVDKLYGGKTERADKGFGSSGKF